MKKLIATPLILLAALAFTGCDDNDDDAPKPQYDVISFEESEHLMDVMTGEDVVLKSVSMTVSADPFVYRKIFCAKDYATDENYDGPLFMTSDQKVVFNSYYSYQWDAWGGIALAQLPNKGTTTYSYANQFSVWADGGANGTKTYAVCYDTNTSAGGNSEWMTESGYPTIDFIVARTVDHLYIANSTMIGTYFTGKDSDLFKVKITGWNGSAEKGSVTETLVSGAAKLEGWRKVSLASFGEVDKLVFQVEGIDITNDPSFFCIDEIALVK